MHSFLFLIACIRHSESSIGMDDDELVDDRSDLLPSFQAGKGICSYEIHILFEMNQSAAKDSAKNLALAYARSQAWSDGFSAIDYVSTLIPIFDKETPEGNRTDDIEFPENYESYVINVTEDFEARS